MNYITRNMSYFLNRKVKVTNPILSKLERKQEGEEDQTLDGLCYREEKKLKPPMLLECMFLFTSFKFLKSIN